jgi:sugar O-acyltransferase (sialic acid O-acetyltransferase NeuD family)
VAGSVFVFGASGHAKVVIDILERMKGVKVAFVVDDAEGARGRKLCGYPVIGGRDALLANRRRARAGIVAIGDNGARARVAEWLAQQGFRAASAIHPAAAIARGVEIGDGTVVMAGAVINSEARIGRHAIINTGATLDHDCAIGDCAHIAPGCNLCGEVSVGAGTLLGVGTCVIPCVRIGAGVVVGAGSTVLRDIPDGARMAGSPCRPVGP